MPLYWLGLMGMTRRMQHYNDPNWQPFLIVAACGALIILAGVVCQIIQLVVSIRTRADRLDRSGDPWNGRTLEWSTPSPPPAWNYALLPEVEGEDAYWHMKRKAREDRTAQTKARDYEPIDMPVNSPTGFITAFFAVITGFALIWHIWWMVGLGLVGAFATTMVFGWRDVQEQEIDAEALARVDRAHLASLTR
jgi:cytochrome o ubiquinol oxidase subunit 1